MSSHFHYMAEDPSHRFLFIQRMFFRAYSIADDIHSSACRQRQEWKHTKGPRSSEWHCTVKIVGSISKVPVQNGHPGSLFYCYYTQAANKVIAQAFPLQECKSNAVTGYSMLKKWDQDCWVAPAEPGSSGLVAQHRRSIWNDQRATACGIQRLGRQQSVSWSAINGNGRK